MQATKLLIQGLVQGVGFRPCVYRVATRLGLLGWVKNTSQGVEIVINSLDNVSFMHDLTKALPRLARIDSVVCTTIPLSAPLEKFHIASNQSQVINETLIPADSCICRDCLRDIFNPDSRYYLYPFTSCSDCGPRYSLIKQLPYGRAQTAMGDFPLCEHCLAEFNDPNSRRFHAEAMACPSCGPKLEINLSVVASEIMLGKIVALKTSAGFTLMVAANNQAAIQRLRQRKQRSAKPFALMALNCASIDAFYAPLDPRQARLLESSSAPIVILTDRYVSKMAEELAPGLDTLGFMLAHSPIYYLLFYYLLQQPAGHDWLTQSHPVCLVTTSANLKGESLIAQDQQAHGKLKFIADRVVGYNREIIMKCDDTLIFPLADENIIIRRARGLAPLPYRFNYSLPQVLGLGAQLKNTLCFTRGNQAHLSQYLGSMKSPDNINYFKQLFNYYQDIYGFEPELIVSDLHPDFFTSIYAENSGILQLRLQHHYAHFAAGLASAESCGRELNPQVLACVLDGYGYGENGEAWGGELISFDSRQLSFKRVSHLPFLTVPGADRAKREPWKLALAWCHEQGLSIPAHLLSAKDASLLVEMVERRLFAKSTSCGDLFGLVSALVGACSLSTYEAEAALRLESLVSLPEIEHHFAHIDADGRPALSQLLNRVYQLAIVAKNPQKAVNVFYGSFAAMLEKWIVYHASIQGIRQVVLSGGCWQSRYLLPLLKKKLALTGIDLLLPYQLPFNDECISFGQAWFGSQQLLRGKSLCV